MSTGRRLRRWLHFGVALLAVGSAPLLLGLSTVIQEAYLKASNTDSNDGFGLGAVSGDTIAIGAPFEDSNAVGVNGDQANNSAPESGAAYVFARFGTVWTQEAYLKASNTEAGDAFGSLVAVAVDTIVVGAPLEDSAAVTINGDQTNNSAPDSGAAYVFVRNGTTWTQQAYLKASNANAGDLFGTYVAISGDTIVVGAYAEDGAGSGVNPRPRKNEKPLPESGAAYVFVRNGTTWTQQAYLKASNPDPNDGFGLYVAIDGDTIVVGAYNEASSGRERNNSTPGAGAAYVFARSGTTWTQQAYLKASNPGVADNFGAGVAVSGNLVAVGAINESSNSTGVNGDQNNDLAGSSGAAYVFVRNGTKWTQEAYLKASNTGAGDQFGRPALSGNTLVVAAHNEDSAATGINGDQSDNSAPSAGAAYVFVRNGSTWTQEAYLKASNTEAVAGQINDTFGGTPSVSGNTVVIGATREDSSATGVNGDGTDNSAANSGAGYVFVLTN
jgi:FG-GAP repeat protein